MERRRGQSCFQSNGTSKLRARVDVERATVDVERGRVDVERVRVDPALVSTAGSNRK